DHGVVFVLVREVEICALAALAGPGRQLQVVHVGDVVGPVDGHALFGLPLLVRTASAADEAGRGEWCGSIGLLHRHSSSFSAAWTAATGAVRTTPTVARPRA